MMVLIEGKTLQEVSRFVSSKLSPIEDVTGTSTQFVLKKYKDHGTIMFGQKKNRKDACNTMMRNPLSKKITGIEPSGIRKFFDSGK